MKKNLNSVTDGLYCAVSATIQINVMDMNDNVPVFTLVAYTKEINENHQIGRPQHNI